MRLMFSLYILLQLAATPMNAAMMPTPVAAEQSASTESGAVSPEHKSTAVLLHNRITGAPPTAETLAEMVKLLQQQKHEEAALLATEAPAFYDIKLLNMFSAWSNVDANIDAGLNDMIATLIGMVRDDVPFKEALYGDHLYVLGKYSDESTYREKEISEYVFEQFAYYEATEEDIFSGGRHPNYRVHSNSHYARHIANVLNLKDLLHDVKQSDSQNYAVRVGVKKMPASQYTERRHSTFANEDTVYLLYYEPVAALPRKAIAGILSTRGFAKAYYSAGTNRRATAFVLKYFLCHDMHMLHDTGIKHDFIRRDVDRRPSGDANIYEEKCAGCHAGMDALSGWNVYYDFGKQPIGYSIGEQLLYDPQQVNKKINKNDLGGGGHVPQDDSFTNLWTEGQNTILGWSSTTSGTGAKEWGKMLAESEAFASCMATQAFEQICMGKPEIKEERAAVDKMAEYFVTNDYSMKKLFAATAVSCLLEE